MEEHNYVLVIGGASLDVIGQPDEPFISGSSIRGSIHTNLGGVARNIAHNLSKLDVETVLLTVVGDDEPGETIIGRAAGSGIDVSHSLIIENAESGAYLALLDEKGRAHLALDSMGIMQSLSIDYILEKEDLIQNARLIVIDANVPKTTIKTIIDLADHYQVPLFGDPTSSGLASRFQPYLNHFDLITPNPLETEALIGLTVSPQDRDGALTAARKIVAAGATTVVITLGEHGAVYASSETAGHIPAIKTDVLNSTGAGDAMTAAIIFGLLEEIPLDECVRLGVTAATLTLRSEETVREDLSVDLLYDELVI